MRRSRQRIVGAEEFDGDALEAIHTPAPDERLLAFEDVTRAAEALQGLKPQEVRALWLRMEGRTYKEIAEELDWTYTKVNRCVTEGRRAFLTRYAGIEAGEECRRYESDALRLRRRRAARRRDRRAAPPSARLRRVSRRRCAACAAGNRSLGAVLPVGLAVGGLDGGDSALGIFVRVYETLVGNLQERAVTVAAKAQVAAEASGVLKVAAVAGAAAAVAGGGAVTVAEGTPERPAAATPAVREVAQQVPKVAMATAPVVVSAPAASSATSGRAHDGEARPRAREGTLDGGVHVRAAGPSDPSRGESSATSSPARAGGEFDLEP